MKSEVFNQSRCAVLRAANLYYMEGCSQKEIAERLAVSVPTVSRLLKRAKEEGLISFVIPSPYRECLALETQLRESYGLEEVIVVPPDPEGDRDPMAVKRAVALEGARYIQRVIRPHDILGVAWGGTMYELIQYLNPCQRTEAPRTASAGDKVKYFTLEQVQTFLGLLDREYSTTYKAHDRTDDTGKAYHVAEYSETRKLPTQFKLFFLLALFCGCRRGELLALTWADLDFHAGSVSITKSTGIVNGKPLTRAPKTRSSVRVLSVPGSVLEVAKAYRKEQLQYRMALGSKWEGDNYIFIQWNGRQMHPDTPYNTFKRVIRRYNESCSREEDKLPEIPLHGLRHTSATLLISQNVDVRTVSGRLGHAQTSTTMDIYAHSLKKMDEVAAEKLENLLAHGR